MLQCILQYVAIKIKRGNKKNEGYISTEIDGSIVTTHIILEAFDLGLGSVVVRNFETENLKKLFNIPENIGSYFSFAYWLS